MAGLNSLSFLQQAQILSKLAPIADNASKYGDSLIDRSFNSFSAFEEFYSSFCSPEEFCARSALNIDMAKARLISPDGLMTRFFRLSYDSPQNGGDARTSNSFAELSLDKPPSGSVPMRTADPCTLKVRALELQRDVRIANARRAMWARFQELRETEISLHSAKVELKPFDTTECAVFVQQCLSKYLEQYGFKYDEFRSRRFYPVFAKELSPGWDIIWSLKTDRNLRLLPAYGSEDVAPRIELDLNLFVRKKGTRGFIEIPVGFRSLNVMAIQYSLVVSGFDWAYTHFRTLPELDTIIRARVQLYAQVKDYIEPLLQAGLEHIVKPRAR